MDIFLYIIFAVVVGGAIILRWWYNSPKYKGKEGENRVHNILMQLPDDYVILDDIVLQTSAQRRPYFYVANQIIGSFFSIV